MTAPTTATAKSLARCRCVCRSWSAGIAGAVFVRRHLELSPSTASCWLLLLPPPRTAGAETELVFDTAWPGGITRLVSPTHCDGFVAIATATDRVFVCNTVTRELAALSLGSRNAELDHGDPLLPPVALGFDRWRNRYTIGRHHFWLAEDGPELQWSLHFCIDLLVRRKPWTFASRAAHATTDEEHTKLIDRAAMIGLEDSAQSRRSCSHD
ncbi:uncharacterized protein LOC112881281 [Panicum hallii]|uniref:uncharacterized protein LOC112881281 n=1 Tax=Panicum hallii TaxID=206008 RepID=UPI000DF4EBCC|nr:uncharacterized protein LOC112881281 [Panicum hallii]